MTFQYVLWEKRNKSVKPHHFGLDDRLPPYTGGPRRRDCHDIVGVRLKPLNSREQNAKSDGKSNLKFFFRYGEKSDNLLIYKLHIRR